jgi:hypothetical protein
MDCRVAPKRGLIVGALLMAFCIPRAGQAQDDTRFWDEIALWSEFIYTIRDWEKVEWTVTPWIRTDEQELNSGTMTRVTTEATVLFNEDWNLRSRFFLIGRENYIGDVVLDERVQFLLRRLFFRFADDKVRFRGGLFYERHFRGDSIPDFNVYRTRLELRGDGVKNEPWGQTDLFFDHDRGFFRTRTRIGFLWNLPNAQQVRLAYQFQYTQSRDGEWAPQHAIVFRYWFGSTLSWRGVN